MIKYAHNLFNLIFVVAVDLRKENQVKKTKHALNISNKIFGINRKGSSTLYT